LFKQFFDASFESAWYFPQVGSDSFITSKLQVAEDGNTTFKNPAVPKLADSVIVIWSAHTLTITYLITL